MTYRPILMYHRVLSGPSVKSIDPHRIGVSVEQFRRHLSLLRWMGYHTINLGDYVELLRAGRSPDRRTFMITFDDGYEEVLTLAWPVLRDFRFTATVFAVAGQMAGSNRWDDGDARLLSPDQLRELDRNGVTIGSHTLQHAHLTKVDPPRAKQEIADSKKLLEDLVGHPITVFAYPYGETDDTIEAYVREAGYHGAVATDRASPDHRANLFRLRRVGVAPVTTRWELYWKVKGWYPLYRDIKARVMGQTGGASSSASLIGASR